MGILSDLLRLHPVAADRDDVRWNERARGETEIQRLDRNWASLVQELRVLQTGVQLLAGFLMIVPFQPSFSSLGSGGRVLYMVTVGAAMLAVTVLLAPIAMHRLLFRRHQLATVVVAAHRYVLVGMAMVAVSIAGAASMIALVALRSAWAAVAAGGGILTVVIVLWAWIPVHMARMTR
ncbi:DUF6328 family protein [Gordonia sp. CPCC 205333]|uniref:DUF6328 family protein n=1 Tax=Gordonia sp. CPCC 205333 TaxID=3140790 RepID=UPI003AF33ECD